MIEDSLDYFINFAKNKNPFGESITLIGATKTRDVETINRAIKHGLKDVGENKPQEFRDKFPFVLPVNYHFFGRLQSNKVKYLINKACLIQSVDSLSLASTISQLSKNANVETKILLEINLGEEQKGGFPLQEIDQAVKEISQLENVKILGLMTVLPLGISDEEKTNFCVSVRKKYDELRVFYPDFKHLSMGMTHDFEIAVKCGSNMIRIGTGIFGERTYKENTNGVF